MATQPAHDRLETRRFWQVQIVFDPDGTGADFAYTIGLHTRGLPELHIWARPTEGEDPGADWMLSTRDRGSVLNELAGLMVAGHLDVGSEVTREYDGGHTRVVYRIDPPGDREELQAFGVPEGVDVLPVRWELHRAPEGPLRPLAAEAELGALQLYAELTSPGGARRRAPRGWQLPTEPTFEPAQPFGPLTPLVLARAAQLWQADENTLVTLLRAAAKVDFYYSLTHAITVASAVARPHGRSAALTCLHERAHELVESMTMAPAAQRRWRSVARAFDPEWWQELDRAGRQRLERNLAGLLHDVTLSCLAVEAVADVADDELRLAGRGPWERGFSGHRFPCSPEWEASAEVLEVIRGLLVSVDARGLTTIAGMHTIAMTGRVEGADNYPDLCDRLLGWATVSAAVCPRRLLDDLPAWRPVTTAFAGATVVAPPELHEWATCLAAALTHRMRLSADDVRTFTSLYEEDLPRLSALVNGPVPTTTP
jgi:hypothetical protein